MTLNSFDALQKLTEQTLRLAGDEVLIQKTPQKNSTASSSTKKNSATKGSASKKSKNPMGDKLISELVSSKKTVTIKLGKGGNSEYDIDPVNAVYKKNGKPGKGSDTVVSFNPKSMPKIKTIDKKGIVSRKGRPNQIGLGHELIHAHRSMRGCAIRYSEKAQQTYKTTVGNTKKVVAVKSRVPKEELATVGLGHNKKGDITENQLRKEQKQNPRGAY